MPEPRSYGKQGQQQFGQLNREGNRSVRFTRTGRMRELPTPQWRRPFFLTRCNSIILESLLWIPIAGFYFVRGCLNFDPMLEGRKSDEVRR
jgi:hypothetical protein